MDTIEFQVTLSDTFEIVTVVINDCPLNDALGVDYVAIGAHYTLRILTNPREKDVDENGKVCILVCRCGIDDCGSVRVSITETNSSVLWSNFVEYEGERCWERHNFGPFEFDKNEYYQEIEKLKNCRALGSTNQPTEN